MSPLLRKTAISPPVCRRILLKTRSKSVITDYLTHHNIFYIAVTCGEGLAKCVSECKQGLAPCAECLGSDWGTCCPCIAKLDSKIQCDQQPKKMLFLNKGFSADECNIGDAVKCGEAVAPCVSDCKQGLGPCAECIGESFQTCCGCIEKIDPKLPFTCDQLNDDECSLVDGVKCAEAVEPCIATCKTGLEPCLQCLAGDFQTCCGCIEKAIPKLPFTCQ